MISVLLYRRLDHKKLFMVLQEVVITLNCSKSTAIKYVPYNVVFGLSPVVPLDDEFSINRHVLTEDIATTRDYTEEVRVSVNEVFDHVIDHLKLSKIKMQKQYNQKLKYIDYREGKVWFKVKHYKTGENRKLVEVDHVVVEQDH